MDKAHLLSQLKKEEFPKKIIKAFEKVQREKFIPLNLKNHAYEDTALPLEDGATISQPSTIAFMLALLEISDKKLKILEIGSGSGYVLALLSELSPKSKIYGIEIIPNLAEKSKEYLKDNRNVDIIIKNGFNGLLRKAPFDRVLTSASSNYLPRHLYPQLKEKGIIVAPVKNSIFQIKKQNNKIIVREFPGFVFVPLIKNNNNQNPDSHNHE